MSPATPPVRADPEISSASRKTPSRAERVRHRQQRRRDRERRETGHVLQRDGESVQPGKELREVDDRVRLEELSGAMDRLGLAPVRELVVVDGSVGAAEELRHEQEESERGQQCLLLRPRPAERDMSRAATGSRKSKMPAQNTWKVRRPLPSSAIRYDTTRSATAGTEVASTRAVVHDSVEGSSGGVASTGGAGGCSSTGDCDAASSLREGAQLSARAREAGARRCAAGP